MFKYNYVAGFLFNPDKTQVALVCKQKPEWQKGKLNAIGGKIEEDEQPHEAMIREFKEETGLEINDWDCKVQLINYKISFLVHFFAATSDRLKDVRTMETELIGIFDVKELLDGKLFKMMNNLYWLIPVCLANTIQFPVVVVDDENELNERKG